MFCGAGLASTAVVSLLTVTAGCRPERNNHSPPGHYSPFTLLLVRTAIFVQQKKCTYYYHTVYIQTKGQALII